MAISTNLGRLLMRGAPLFNAPIVALAASPRLGRMLRRSITIDHLHRASFGTHVQHSGGLPPPR